jgi:hypothetical protein
LVNQHGGKIVYRLIIVGIGAVVAALLVLGCGSGGGDQGASGGSGQATAQTTSLTEAQFMAQAKTLCKKTQQELVALLLAKNASTNPDRFRQSGSLLKKEARELEAIAGPEQVEAKVEPLIASITKAGVIIAQEGEKGLLGPRVAAYKQEASALHLSSC